MYCNAPALAGPLAGSLDHLQLGGLLPVRPHLRCPLPAARVLQVASVQGAEGQSKSLNTISHPDVFKMVFNFKALEILKKIAKFNKKTVSEEIWEQVGQFSDEQMKAEKR